MCAISEEIFNKGLEQGLEEGLERERDEGARGRLLENVRSLMQTVGWSAQEALENLMVPKEEQGRYLAML